MNRHLPIAAAAGALAIAAAAAAAAAAQPAARWTPVSFGGQPKVQQVYFIDPASITKKGGSADFRALIIYRTPSERGVDRAIEKSRANCTDRSSRSLGTTFLNGTQVRASMPEQKEIERYPEGTPWRILVDSVCDNDLPDFTTADPRGWAQQRYFSK